jgi:hypothetical protein
VFRKALPAGGVLSVFAAIMDTGFDGSLARQARSGGSVYPGATEAADSFTVSPVQYTQATQAFYARSRPIQ